MWTEWTAWTPWTEKTRQAERPGAEMHRSHAAWVSSGEQNLTESRQIPDCERMGETARKAQIRAK